ncbi:hypothetical protein [Pacificibacter marinus]|uniref:hypothetical protein n=1 Tax=Pacificibacter marinus TaxID=658057 RepID=UPI001C065203|nr:hypothetical protein [Pacificibacter marinus]MBU2867023.1 hypothetical protein [Pacificibacter marinus]
MAQSANLWMWGWGRGECLGPADTGSGGTRPLNEVAKTAEDEDALKSVLERFSAKEAIDSVSGEQFAGKIEDLIDDLSEPNGNVSFPGPISEAFYWSDGDVVGIQGPVGSGKTTTLMKSRLRRAIMMPRSTIDGVRRYKVVFIRETYRQLWSTTIPSYLEAYPKSMGQWSGGRGDPVTHKMHFEDEYGPIEFTAEFKAFGDDIVASMRGLEATDIVLNEADTMPVLILTVAIGRIDRYPGRQHFAGLADILRSYGQICCDFNAPDEENWTFGVFHDEEERTKMSEKLTSSLPEGAKAIEMLFFLQPGYGEEGCENLQNLSPGYYPRQIAINELAGRGDMNERLVYNKITYMRVGDPIFLKHFNRRIHVAEDTLVPIAGIPLSIGLDQGFKPAAVIGQFIPSGTHGYWRLYAELHFPKERLLAKVFGDRLAVLLSSDRFSRFRVDAGWGDMAGEAGSSLADDENENWNLLAGGAAGITIRPQTVGANRINPRLEAMRSALDAPLVQGHPGLLCDPSMKFFIAGLSARYVWVDAVDTNGDKRKVPDKSHTEANVIDATQYLFLSQFLANGMSPNSLPNSNGQIGHNGGPSMSHRGAARPSGLITGHDILNPYGD